MLQKSGCFSLNHHTISYSKQTYRYTHFLSLSLSHTHTHTFSHTLSFSSRCLLRWDPIREWWMWQIEFIWHIHFVTLSRHTFLSLNVLDGILTLEKTCLKCTEAIFLVVLETSWERARNEFHSDCPLHLVPCSFPARLKIRPLVSLAESKSSIPKKFGICKYQNHPFMHIIG